MAINSDIFPLKMVIFHSYVSLPEGTGIYGDIHFVEYIAKHVIQVCLEMVTLTSFNQKWCEAVDGCFSCGILWDIYI